MRVTFWLFAHRFGYHADIAMRNEHRVRKLVTHPILVIEKLPQIVTLVVHVDATSGVRVMFHNDSGNLASRREVEVGFCQNGLRTQSDSGPLAGKASYTCGTDAGSRSQAAA